jgi:hypothetical protein
MGETGPTEDDRQVIRADYRAICESPTYLLQKVLLADVLDPPVPGTRSHFSERKQCEDPE